jgi:hypothetical protein
MHRHRVVRIVILTLLACTLWLWGASSALADCPGNVAVNPGFEDGFTERGAGEVTVANGWHPFWQAGPFEADGYNRRPEYKGEDAARFGRRRVRSGNWSQKLFNTYATHHAGIWQQISVTPGSLVTLSAWGQAWSSEESDPGHSRNGKYEMSVGIDPTGGTDFNSGNIVWSPRNGTLDQWVQMSVQARAQGGTVTLFLRGDAEYRLKHNDAYFDDVCVTLAAPPPPPTRPPQPTSPPRPTNTPEPTETPGPTETPEPTETLASGPTSPTVEPVTPTPEPGSIRVLAFEDKNGDGERGEGESLLAGVEIMVMNAKRTPVASLITDGSGVQVFDDLPPGSYILIETLPAGYVSTSPKEWAVALAPGTEIEVAFASQFAPSPTPTHEPTATPALTETPVSESPTDVPTATPVAAAAPAPRTRGLGSISGILLVLLALALPISLRLLKARL